jgi:tetratricopeptide (TPR) repeat protein
MAIDLTPLWNFADPVTSEQNFREALRDAIDDDVLILQTQIARTHGLRKDFPQAQAILQAIEPQIALAGPEARVRYLLELGRSLVSATHEPQSLTAEATLRARQAYEDAWTLAKTSGLDALAIDAIHMLAFIDTAPQAQLKWGRAALAVVETSDQPAAKNWEPSIRNNIGMALHQLHRYEEALAEFTKAVQLRNTAGDAGRRRIAEWMVAWTLRAMNRLDEALQIQIRLELECAAAREPDPYVFEELSHLYRAQGDEEKAAYYTKLQQESTG